MIVSTLLKHKGGDVIAVDPNDTIATVARVLHKNRIGAALVRDKSGEIQGIISERDVVSGIAEKGERCLTLNAAEFMTADVVYCAPGDSLNDIMALMTDRRMRHLPVMADGKLLGIISIGDVVKHRVAEIEQETKALREYIATG